MWSRRRGEPHLVDELLCTDQAGGCYLLLQLFLHPLLCPSLRERRVVGQEGKGQGLAEEDGAMSIGLRGSGRVRDEEGTVGG